MTVELQGIGMTSQRTRDRLIQRLREAGIQDERVLAVMRETPRHIFVDEALATRAYEDTSLPIGFGQTISQPYIIALMTEALELTGSEKVLEVGTGSGYQAAILAGLAQLVITTERIPELAESARKILDSLGYTNIKVHLAGETLGWPPEAPYDAIMVTAGAPRIPADLLAQLAMGGRLVIPVGSRYVQELCKITKGRKNVVQNLGGCRFVSLIGKDAWEEE